MRYLPLAASAAVITLSLGLAAVAPASALTSVSACDPEECEELPKVDRERDRAEIRRLNREQLRYVQRRDAEYKRGWDAQERHAQDMAAYEAQREAYERRMAEWREAVRRCEAGDYRYCGG